MVKKPNFNITHLSKAKPFYKHKVKILLSFICLIFCLFLSSFNTITTANNLSKYQSNNDSTNALTLSPCSDINFSKFDFSAAFGAGTIATADIDGDGKPDLITASANANNSPSEGVSILRNTSTSGTIDANSFAPKVDFLTVIRAFSTAVGDFDSDGKLDLAFSNIDTASVSVFRNTSSIGNISLAPKVDFPTGSFAFSVATGDLDGDGKLDLAVSNAGSNTLSILRNTSSIGNISFASKIDFAVGSNAQAVAIGDLDQDGKLDLVVANGISNTLSVFKNTSTNGMISLATRVDFATSNDPRSIAIVDLDQDGKLDLAVTNSTNSNTLSIFRNTSISGMISFATKLDFAANSLPISTAVGDFDKDGKPDLAIVNSLSNLASIFLNTSTIGTISLATKVDFATGNNPFSIVVEDLDGDGREDLATANLAGNTTSVLRRVCMNNNTTDHNTIYVADTLNNRIQRSTNNGQMWQVVGNGAGVGLGQFNAPRGVATNSSDTIIFVADTGNNRIQRSTNGGLNWAVIATAGTAINQVNQPNALAYDESSNKLYIADTANNRILLVTNASTTNPIFSLFAGASAGTTTGKFNQPQSVAVNASGNVYVADTANNRIQVNSNGLSTGWTILATAGSAMGQVNMPKGMYVDGSERIWVADTANNRIQVNINGIWSAFMSAGTLIGAVNRPEGVVVNLSGNAFIADTGNNRIQSKPASGGNAIVVGQPGLNVGKFNQPSGIR